MCEAWLQALIAADIHLLCGSISFLYLSITLPSTKEIFLPFSFPSSFSSTFSSSFCLCKDHFVFSSSTIQNLCFHLSLFSLLPFHFLFRFDYRFHFIFYLFAISFLFFFCYVDIYV